MSWYDFLILRFQDYKWILFAPFAVFMFWGIVQGLRKKSQKLPTYLFVGSLVLWLIIWIIATIFYRTNL